MQTFRLESFTCPAGCGYVMDSVTAVHGEQMPREGDFSLCMNCGAFLRYEKDLSVRHFTHEELVDTDTKTRKMLHDTHEAWTHIKKRMQDSAEV